MMKHPLSRVTLLTPLRDDWCSAAELIRRIDLAIAPDECVMEILLVGERVWQTETFLLSGVGACIGLLSLYSYFCW